MSEPIDSYNLQFDKFSDSDLEKFMRRLDGKQTKDFLSALENYNSVKEREIASMIEESARKKRMCEYYLEELWNCVSEDERAESASFFKEQAEEIKNF